MFAIGNKVKLEEVTFQRRGRKGAKLADFSWLFTAMKLH